MNIEYKEFIGFYRNLFPAGYCQHMIKEFERIKETGVGSNRKNSEDSSSHEKDDYHMFINATSHPIDAFEGKDSRSFFYEGLQVCYDEYIEKYSILKKMSLRSFGIKMQKTSPGGGYHLWHSEQGPKEQASRTIVYLFYLNSLDSNDGGETEFLYQKLRVKPEENMMLLWPASYTHTHKGNLVLGNTAKYVITGWFNCD